MNQSLVRLALACGVFAFTQPACDVSPETEGAPPGATGATQESGSATPMQLVASVTVASGNTFDFLQEGASPVVIVEKGQYPNRRTDVQLSPDENDAVAIYRKISGRSEAPESLLAAVARAAKGVSEDDLKNGARSAKATPNIEIQRQAFTTEGAAPDSGDGSVDQLCPSSWFQDNMCQDAPWNFCWLRRIGNWRWGPYSVGSSNHAACSYRGNIALTVNTRNCGFLGLICTDSTTVVPIGPGRWASIFRYIGGGFSVSSSLTVSGNAGWHHSGMGE